ncbi:hypothetical protein ACOMHN_048949 [Nucella lapillus]
MCQWTERLDSSELTKAFSQAKVVCYFSDVLMTALAEQALRLDELSTAVSLTQEARLALPQSVLLSETWEHVSYAAVERWHFKMLNDVNRNTAYHDAIVATVQKNALSSVLDIGCGTGLLSVFAEQGGAKHVTLCDAAPVMTQICSAVVASHRQRTQATAQLRVFEARSTTLSVPRHLPERVDLVVAEIFDAALFGEHCLSSLSHAWSHLLHNGPHRRGQVIPRAAELYVCAIQCPQIRKENCVQQGGMPLLDLSGVHITSRTCVAEDEPYTTEDLFFVRNSYTFLSPVQTLMRVDFNDPQALERLCDHSQDLILDVYAQGTVDALAVWFDLDLCEGVKVSTGPSDRCCWEQAIFPVVTVGGEDKAGGDSGVCASPKVNCGDQLKIHCSLKDGCLRLQVQDVVALGYFLHACHISRPSSSDTEHVCGQTASQSASQSASGTEHVCGQPASQPANQSASQSDSGTEHRHPDVCVSSRSVGEPGCQAACDIPRAAEEEESHSSELSAVTEKSLNAHDLLTAAGGGLPDVSRSYHHCEPLSVTEEVGGHTVCQPCSGVEAFAEGTKCFDDDVHRQKRAGLNGCGCVESEEAFPASNRTQQCGGLRTDQNQCVDSVDTDTSDCFSCQETLVDTHCTVSQTSTYCLHNGTHRPPQTQHGNLCSESPCDSPVLNGRRITDCMWSKPPSTGDQVSIRTCCKEKDACLHVNGVRTGGCEVCTNVGGVHQDSRATEPRMQNCSCSMGTTEGSRRIPNTTAHLVSPDHAEPVPESRISDSVQNHRGDPPPQPGIQHNLSDTFHLQREEIRHLNDGKFNSLLLSALQHARTRITKPPSLWVVSSSPPLNGFLALKSGFSKAAFCYVGDSDREEVEGVMNRVGVRNGISRSQWRWCGREVEDRVGEEVDVAWVDVVEMSGCLRPGVLKDLKDLRRGASQGTVVVPQAVDVYAVLIDSEHLESMSRVTSDRNTLGVSVAPHINPFQTQTFLDLDIHTLPHENLSDVIHVFHLDLQSCVTSAVTSERPADTQSASSEFRDRASNGLESSSSASNSESSLSSSNLESSLLKSSNLESPFIVDRASDGLQSSSQSSNLESSNLQSSSSSSNSSVDPLDCAFRQCKQVGLRACKSGRATALVLWFDQQLAPGVRASTVDPTLNWRQAAVLLDGQALNQGQQLVLTARLEQSYLHFSLG